jgi:hypothetical protein
MGKTMHSNDEWNNLIYELHGHACLMALEDGNVPPFLHHIQMN